LTFSTPPLLVPTLIPFHKKTGKPLYVPEDPRVDQNLGELLCRKDLNVETRKLGTGVMSKSTTLVKGANELELRTANSKMMSSQLFYR
jgi:hypothetical protein